MTLKWLVRTVAPCASRRRRLRRDEDAFSLLEVVVAVGIFSVVMILLSTMLASGMRGVLLGKRREVAVQEANKLVEYSRSLAYQDIGLAQDDTTLDSDPAIVDIGGVKSVLVDPDTNTYEPILWATNPTGHPYSPHIQTVERGSSTLTTYVYVTGVDTSGDGNHDLARILTRVVWDDSGTTGPANEVRVQTFADESGVLPIGTTVPGGGTNTGLTPMWASTQVTGGTASIRSDRGNLLSLVDAVLPQEPVGLSLPTLSGTTRLRAVSETNCSAISALLESPTNDYGKHTVSVTADDDSRTDTPEQPPDQSWSGSPESVLGGGAADELLVETSLASPISCHASAIDQDALAPADDQLPYEKGTGSGPGSLAAPSFLNFTEDLTGAVLPSDTLTALSLGTSTATQEIDHRVTGSSREIVASASGSVAQTHVMKIPSYFPEGLVRVDAFNYSATAVASEGTPSAAPEVTIPGGVTILVYDPASAVSGCDSRSSNYCTKTVDPGAAGFGGFTASYANSLTANLGLTTVSYEIDVRVFPPSETPQDGSVGPSGERRWSASYTGIQISTRLRIEVKSSLLAPSVLLTDTQTDVSLVNLTVQGCAGVGCPV